MNWEAMGAIGETAGAVGVIVTLVFLAMQIRQNSRVATAATFDLILAEWRQLERDSFIENPDNIQVFADGLMDFASLDLGQKRLFNYIMSQYALFIENMIRQHQHGNIQYSQLEPWMNFYSMLIRAPGGSDWWQQSSRVLSKTLRETMNAHGQAQADMPDIIASIPFFFRAQS